MMQLIPVVSGWLGAWVQSRTRNMAGGAEHRAGTSAGGDQPWEESVRQMPRDDHPISMCFRLVFVRTSRLQEGPSIFFL